jgi:hypothetical protein
MGSHSQQISQACKYSEVLGYAHTTLCHPRELELSMFALRIWRCIDYLHRHLHLRRYVEAADIRPGTGRGILDGIALLLLTGRR